MSDARSRVTVVYVSAAWSAAVNRRSVVWQTSPTTSSLQSNRTFRFSGKRINSLSESNPQESQIGMLYFSRLANRTTYTRTQSVLSSLHVVEHTTHYRPSSNICIFLITNHQSRDLRSFVIRFDFESYVRLEIRFVLMVRFEIFESSALSIVIRKETIGSSFSFVKYKIPMD